MAKMTEAKLRANLRDKYLTEIVDYFSSKGDDPRHIKNNAIMIPTIDELGNEKYITITIAVPTGGRDGLGFDGYEAAEDYKREAEEKAEKAEKRRAENAAKAAERKAKQEAALRKKMEEQAAKLAKMEAGE